MCLMCIEVAKNRMKSTEARRALKELIATAQKNEDLSHYQELSSLSDEDLKKKAEEYAHLAIRKK